MTPIRASYHYTVEVPIDPENPDHKEWIGLSAYVNEERSIDGLLVDIVLLENYDRQRLLKGTDDSGHNTYQEAIGSFSTVYAVFWANKGDFYQLMVVPYHQIRTNERNIREFVNRGR